MINLAVEYLRVNRMALDDFEGQCGELVDEIIHWLGESRVKILSMRTPDGQVLGGRWGYHVAPLIDGVVHDAWYPDCVLPPDQYVKRAFPDENIDLKVFG